MAQTPDELRRLAAPAGTGLPELWEWAEYY